MPGDPKHDSCSCVPYEPRDCSLHGPGATDGRPAEKPPAKPKGGKPPK